MLFQNLSTSIEEDACHLFLHSSVGYRQGLRFVLSPEPTPASKMYLAKRFKWATLEEKVELDQVEVCPQALKITQEIGKRVGEDGGGALVIDYGEDKLISDSLQVSCHIQIIIVTFMMNQGLHLSLGVMFLIFCFYDQE